MPLPGNMTKISVTGKYLDIFGLPIIGSVSFSISPVLINASAQTVIVPRTVKAPLNSSGAFTVQLPATNDPDVVPTGYTIQVTEEFEGGGGRNFSIELPEDIPQPVDITTFTLSTPPGGGSVTYATQSALNAEIIARQDGDKVLLAKTPEYINVKGFPYLAKGDDTTDDIAALQAALYACPPGGVVYAPAGKYRTSAPLVIPPHVSLVGSHANGEQLPTDTAPRSSIKPLLTFSGDAVIKINDKLTASYSDESREQQIKDLTIDGSALSPASTVDGIKMNGYIQSVNLRDICIWKVTGNGIICLINGSVVSGSQAPLSMKWHRVIAYHAGGNGFTLFNSTDCTFTDVVALGCEGDGWYIEGPANSTFQSCRAEWSAGEGFKLQPKFGPVTLNGCSTDSNDKNGISIIGGDWDSSVLLTGARLNRDGRNGGAGGGLYSGLRVETNVPVLVDGVMVNARRDDNTTGPLRPDYAVSVLNSQSLVLHAGYLNAILGGLNDLGGNSTVLRGPNVEEKIGNMIGAATIRKRGIRAEPDTVQFFNSTGVDYDLLHPCQWAPEDQGMAAWTADFSYANSGVALVSGQIYLAKLILSGRRTITKLAHHLMTAGSGLTAGQCFAGLYNASGVRLGVTGDLATSWASSGYKNPAMTGGAVNLTPGAYYIAILAVGTTPPSMTRVGAGATSLINAELPTTGLRAATYGAGQTALPSNLTMSSMTSFAALLCCGLVP